MQKELPLLSKLHGNEVRSFVNIPTNTELDAPITKNNGTLNEPNQASMSENRATEFSNV